MSTNNSTLRVVVLAILVGFMAGGIGGTLTNKYLLDYFFDENKSDGTVVIKEVEQRTYVEDSDGIQSIDRVGPAVVSIVATGDLKIYHDGPSSFRPSNGDFRQKLGGGTGFIVTNDGLVLTNRHVIQDQGVTYSVVLKDGTEFGAEVVSIDPFYDIAVIRMVVNQDEEETEGKKKQGMIGKLPVVEFGNSDKLKVGQKIFAIGNALAQYENTVTAGIISAKGRDIMAGGLHEEAELLSGLLQTDAAINPGNSGGPLINLKGEVVGVNVATDEVADSIGFAIPINDIKPILKSIGRHGKIIRPILGVRYMLLTREKARELMLDVKNGALISALMLGGSAEKAGLRNGDVILEVAGQEISIDYPLQRVIQEREPGDEIQLKIWRNGKIIDLTAWLGKQE